MYVLFLFFSGELTLRPFISRQVRNQVRQGRLRAEGEEGVGERRRHLQLRGGKPRGQAGGLRHPRRPR